MGFRENLKSQLEYLDMPVKELAVRSGVKKKTIDSYLGNRGYTPSVDAAVSIAQALGVSVEYLVNGTNSKQDRPFSSFHEDIQKIVLVSEQLNSKDRNVIINLARFLQNG
ncbi:MAG: helix-turn-helix domain-containing protein [Treponema sp.]|jgi:transcriptional regulator with XRE-family HTH domain|nr:helix-turn-helix domain-containing protein [Treponema sp.]